MNHPLFQVSNMQKKIMIRAFSKAGCHKNKQNPTPSTPPFLAIYKERENPAKNQFQTLQKTES